MKYGLLLAAFLLLLPAMCGAVIPFGLTAPPAVTEIGIYGPVRLINNMHDGDTVGYRFGGFFRPEAYVLPRNCDSLITYFASSFSSKNQSAPELLIVLHKLWLDDRADAGQICTFHIRAQLFLSGTGAYHLASDIDTIFEVEQKILKSTPPLLLAGTQTAQLLIAAGRNKELNGRNYSLEEAARYDDSTRTAYPLFRTLSPPKGIYTDVNSFLQLTPSDTAIIAKHVPQADGPALELFYRQKENGKQGRLIRWDEAAFIYDGQHWFIRRDKSFTRLNKIGDDYFTVLNVSGAGSTNLSFGIGVLGEMLHEAVSPDASAKEVRHYYCRFSAGRKRFKPVYRLRKS